MLKSKINTLFIIILIGLVLLGGVYAITRQYQSVDYQAELNTIVHEAVIKSFDYSSRIGEDMIRFDTEQLGMYVTEGIDTSKTFAKADSLRMGYEFLYGGEEVYGFRATATVDGVEYHSTYVIDKKK